jgi:hypothetical protein
MQTLRLRVCGPIIAEPLCIRVARIADREMSLKANVTVVSWENAISLRKELHQRELAAVAEEIARSVGRAIFLPTNLRGRGVYMYRDKEVRSMHMFME